MFKTIIIGAERKAEIFQHLLAAHPEFEVSGYFNPDDEANGDGLGNLLYTYELAERADVFMVDRHVHFRDHHMLSNLVKLGKHILFDGYFQYPLNDLDQLMRLHDESRNCIHFANVLNNRPLFTTASQFLRKPRFIKLEKYCNAPAPGHFDKWLFQNLSQELDLILRTASSNIRSVSARPLFLFGKNPDLLNIHIEFDNDAICHITAGRAIEPGINKMRIFQQDKLFLLDFTENRLDEYRPATNKDQLSILPNGETPENESFNMIERSIMPFDSWKMELRNFAENIHKRLTPASHLEHLADISNLSSFIVEKVQRRYHEV
jgi:hypothetical protein